METCVIAPLRADPAYMAPPSASVGLAQSFQTFI